MHEADLQMAHRLGWSPTLAKRETPNVVFLLSVHASPPPHGPTSATNAREPTLLKMVQQVID